ncbi:RHS repeat domain-containing protein [Flagellimonas pacifica]|uniref:YD repeat-containing protein n=1 Tax=Flagellimonas pacifica TaxID=1247520 RepID=A0A285MR83_9FLAO|nr:RHS repeat domain-containing protein [Allomuricauda parva]SNY99689.1 YD repeat-containing protein [Allomuricauda parva]
MRFLKLVLCLIPMFGFAQNSNQLDGIFPPSPEASAMAEYAKIPVDLYTGLAQINLPLLELKGKNLNIPISITYHSAGNKVNEIASSIGLGWSLNAGGVITRTVRGKPDDHEDGYVGTNQRGQNVDYIFDQIKPYFNTFSFNTWDAQPDVYFFNFLGQTGRFVLSATGEVIMTPERDFKILPAFGPMSTNNYWTIIDKNGIKYKFGVNNLEKEEGKTVSTFGSSVSTTEDYIASWYLSAIEMPDGELFTFEYVQRGDLVYETSLELYTTSALFGNGYGNVTNVTDVNNHKTLSKISSRYGRVDIVSVADRNDLANATKITELKLYNHSGSLIKTIKLNQDYFTSKENCSQPECKRLKLKSVSEEYRYLKSIKKYEFDYNSTKLPRRDSPEIDHWGYYNSNGQANLISRNAPNDINIHRTPNESAAKARILEKITYSTGGWTLFNYGLNQWNNSSSNIDSGGLRIESQEDNDNFGNSVVTNYNYVHEGTTNSSGTEYSKPIYKNSWKSVSSFIKPDGYSQPTYDGGFRTQSSSLSELFDLNGAAVSYGEVIVEYADGSKEINKYSDLISNGDPYSNDNYFRTHSRQTIGTVTNILEYTSPLGKPFGPPTKRKAYQRGMLTEKVVKDPSGNKTYQINNIYQPNSSNLKSTPGYAFDQIYLYKEYAPDPFGNPHHYANEFQYYVSKYLETNESYRVTQSTEKTFDGANSLTSITDYTYTNQKPTIVKTQTASFSNGDVGKVSYTYPFELTGTINNRFTQNNQISDYVEKFDYINNVQQGHEERIFGYNTFGYTNNGGTPLPKQTNFKKKNLNAYTNLVVDRYDSYGNVLQYHGNDNVPISIIWGYGNRYPVVKVVNATYSDATDSGIGLNMSILNASSSSSNALRAEINKIRNHTTMAEAKVTGYTYVPLMGVTSITDPRGYLTTYEYDDFNRLQYIKDQDGYLVSENQYHYLAQYNGNGSSANQLIVGVTYGASSDTYQDFIASASGGTGIYTYKWYKGIGTSSSNFESTHSGTTSTFRLNVSCSTYQWVKLVTTSGGLTSTRIIRSNNTPCSSGGGGGSSGGGGQNQQ